MADQGVTKQAALERILRAKNEQRRALARLPFEAKFKLVAEMGRVTAQTPRDQLDRDLLIAVPPGQDREFAWPYNGMVHDLETAIRGKAQFLAALGLLSYSESLGRLIGKATGSGQKSMTNEACFARFTIDYMGVDYGSEAEAAARNAYDCLRNGLAHQYQLKGAEWSISLFCTHGPACSGIHVSANRPAEHVSVSVVPFFNAFVRGVRRWVEEERKLNRPRGAGA